MSIETGEKKSPPTYETVGYIDLLRRNRSFRQLWLGQVVSQMGDWFDTIALYTIILNLTGSGRDIGLLLVARFVPSFLFGPLSGVVADRFSRQQIMIISDLLRAVVVLGFLFVRRADQLWIVYVLTVLQLGLSTFFEPAKTAAIPSIVEDRELVAANAISSVTWSAMLTIGAAIGGLITGWFGTNVAFILDAASYLLSAALIASIRVQKRRKRERRQLTFGRALGITETIEGIRYVKDRPRVLALLLVKPAWGVGGGILTLLAVFGERIFPVGKSPATGIGVLFAARGIGTAVGPIVARRLAGEGERRMQASIGISFLIAGAFYVAFGSIPADSEKRQALEKDLSPFYFVTKQTPPTLIVHGDADALVPIQQSQRIMEKFEEAGVPHQLVVRPGKGHGWPTMGEDLPLLADWFEKYLPAGK